MSFDEKFIRSILKKTYFPFFSRFGKLTPIQINAIPKIMEGKNCVLVSPAATGKTEAVVAPLVERIIRDGKPSPLSIIYITPTRALVNDIEKRIFEPIKELGVSLGVRTGDRMELKIKEPQNFIISTPESLDSMLCRYKELFENLKSLIVDEIHLLHGNYRGDQLRCLIRRIEKINKGKKIQFVALSATIEKPENVVKLYFLDAVIIREGITKPFKLKLVKDFFEGIEYLKENKRNKILIFVNSRKDAEEVSMMLKKCWPASRILVHHGSLSRAKRHEVEKVMREWKWGICIATTTLESGIDIGDINAVLLYKVPSLPSTFLQRIARGCRKEQEIFAVGVYTTHTERELFLKLAKIAMQDRVEDTEYSPDLSVVVQQVFSILFGNPCGFLLDEINEITEVLCEKETLIKILTHLSALGFVEKKAGKYFATTTLMDMAERGIIHSNISDEREYELKDISTGNVVGKISVSAEVGSILMLGGFIWEVIAKEKRVLIGRKVDIKTMAKFRKRQSYGAFFKYLPEEFKNSGESGI